MQNIVGYATSITGNAIGEFSSSSLDILSWLGIILLLGIVCSILSKKLGISNILLLVFSGLFIGNLNYEGVPIAQSITESSLFLVSVGTLALVMIVFDSASKLKLREFDTFSARSLSLSILFLFLNLIFLTTAVYLIFSPDMDFAIANFGFQEGYQYIPGALCLIFSVIMSGTDPAVVLSMLKSSSNKVIEILKVESVLNTPLIVLFPFIILDILFQLMNGGGMNGSVVFHIVDQIMPFLNTFVAGIGAGVVMGLIVFKMMKRQYSDKLSPLAVITAAILTYILAERLGGNGVLAVTTLGLFFGNVSVKQKDSLQEFSSLLSNALEILVFVLIGIIIGQKIPLTLDFFARSLLLFIIYLVIRFIAVVVTFKQAKIVPKHVDYNISEIMYMTLNVPKGIAVAVLAFILSTHTLIESGYFIPGIQIILNLTLVFMLYSIILSTIVVKFTKFFLFKPKIL